MKLTTILLLNLVLISACQTKENKRWYTPEEVQVGRKIYQLNCQKCHGLKAVGEHPNWRQALPNGKFPAPPLNGSAHSWHHDMNTLMSTIYQGNQERGGRMPTFKDTLSEQEIKSVIAYFQSLWPNEIYSAWESKKHY